MICKNAAVVVTIGSKIRFTQKVESIQTRRQQLIMSVDSHLDVNNE